jgi:decaprenylphospho-beta-D-erythro-pentofuranosid-2-ulose 2-reductase
MDRILIVGATSAIAAATARRFASAGASLFLVGRNATRLGELADDLRTRGAALAQTFVMDATDVERHEEMLAAAVKKMDGLDAVLVAYGTLPDQQQVQASASRTVEAFHTNATSVISLLTLVANHMEAQGSGCIAVISSVAGDRGRPSNYVYGAAKGAVTLFLQGLRARLQASGVSVVTIKPGFVDTPMTAHLPKNPLFASADRVGDAIYRAMLRGRDTVYVPFFWRPIMGAIRAVPELLFKRLKL